MSEEQSYFFAKSKEEYEIEMSIDDNGHIHLYVYSPHNFEGYIIDKKWSDEEKDFI